MILETILGSGLVVTAGASLVGYGRLQQSVTDLREDVGRLDDRIADLTDFLLREAKGDGENLRQVDR